VPVWRDVCGMKVDYKRLKHPAMVFLLLGIHDFILISVFFLDRTTADTGFRLGPVSFQPRIAKPRSLF